jgi:hypothetical protein
VTGSIRVTAVNKTDNAQGAHLGGRARSCATRRISWLGFGINPVA